MGAGWQAGLQTCGKQTIWQADKQKACVQAGREAGKQHTNEQTNKQAN
jgi:hypothetical protein